MFEGLDLSQGIKHIPSHPRNFKLYENFNFSHAPHNLHATILPQSAKTSLIWKCLQFVPREKSAKNILYFLVNFRALCLDLEVEGLDRL